MKTIRDAVQCIRGITGAVVCAMPPEKKAPFLTKAKELGIQIARDNGLNFETADIEDSTPLSTRAQELLLELSSIKTKLILQPIAIRSQK